MYIKLKKKKHSELKLEILNHEEPKLKSEQKYSKVPAVTNLIILIFLRFKASDFNNSMIHIITYHSY